MNIHEKVERLTKELDDQYKLLNEIKKQLEPEITEGQYWEAKYGVYRVLEVKEDGVLLKGISNQKPASALDRHEWVLDQTLLSDKEVEQALIKEAKRRGFVKGAKVNSLSGYGTGTIKVKDSDSCVDGIYDYWSGSDRLWAYSDNEGGSMKIYSEGEWAEIIEDEWEVKNLVTSGMGKYVVTKGDRWINCSHGNPLERGEAYAIKHALNNLDND